MMRKRLFGEHIPNHRSYTSRFKGKSGLEIGGPSRLFTKRGLIPVYSVVGSLDGCNFHSTTVWEGRIQEGPDQYRYAKGTRTGYQYIREAVDLRGIGTEAYDFVLSSHCIEHTANPLRAIGEWMRVLKTEGYFLLVVPHKDGTFDHQRPVTPLKHLAQDFEGSISEADLTHLPEILQLHDLTLDPLAGGPEAFRRRSLRNAENRCLHHHVFNTELVVRMLDHLRVQVLDVQLALPYHIIVLARKAPASQRPDNAAFLSPSAPYRLTSPFPTDRMESRSRDRTGQIL